MSQHETDESMPELLSAMQALERLRKVSAVTEAVDIAPACQQSTDGEKFRIGRFVIERELGRGGLGIVLLAYDPTLRRSVALKVPHLETLFSSNAHQRFEREAQIASRLTHPNIIAVLEAGSVGPVSFIASAYTEGVSLSKWLAKNSTKVLVDQAVRLVADLAGAIAYAHDQGVLHRDLKPANVILEPRRTGLSVTESSSESALSASAPPSSEGTASPDDLQSLDDFVPKITDFGLAKVLGESVGVTQSKAILGTPAYMTPEQASGKSSDLNATADVYALGVMLYELLTGKPPFAGQNDSEILMRVVHEEPLPPRKLRPDLPAELEAVVLKCVEKKPQSRYQSAADLESELRRFLAGEPLTVRPLSFLGSTTRLAKKHPLTAGLLASVVVLSLAVGTVSTVAYLSARAGLVRERQLLAEAQAARDAAKTRELAEAEARGQTEKALAAEKIALQEAQSAQILAIQAQTAAEAETDKAIQVSKLLSELFLTADPLGLASVGLRSGDEVSMKLPLDELLERGSRYARKNFGDQPLVGATVMDTIGRVYSNLGQMPEAAPLLEDAYSLRQQHGATAAELATSKLNLGLLRHWQGKFHEAETLIEESLQTRTELFGPDDLQVAEALLSLVMVKVFGAPILTKNYQPHQIVEHIAETDAMVERAHSIRLKKLGPKHRDVGMTLTMSALAQFHQGRTEEAQKRFLQATTIFSLQDGGNLLLRAFSKVAMGTTERAKSNYVEAINHYRQALPIVQEQLGKRHVMTLMLMAELAGTLQHSGNILEAESLILEVIDLSQTTMPDHPLLTQPIREVRSLAMQRGDFAAADRFSEYLDRIESRQNAVPSDPGKRWQQVELAIIRGQFAEAAELLNLGMNSPQATSEGVPITADRQAYLYYQAELACCLGDTDRAYAMLRQIIDEAVHMWAVLNDARCMLGILESRRNPTAGSKYWLADLITSIQWIENGSYQSLKRENAALWSLFIVGCEEIKAGRVDDIEQQLQAAWEHLQKYGLPGSYYVGYAESVMGVLFAARNNTELAESHLLNGLKTMRQARGPGHWLIRESAQMLVDFYRQQGRDADAQQYEELLLPASL